MITRDYSDKDLRAALGSSPPLEKMKMGITKRGSNFRGVARQNNCAPAEIARLIDYNPQTGILTWKRRDESLSSLSAVRAVKAWNTKHAGKPALVDKNKYGHLHGHIYGRSYVAHRVAWAIFHGKWPDHYVDHINGNPADNRNNKSGHSGISYYRGINRWVVKVCRKHVGCFSSLEEAVICLKETQAKVGGFTERHGTP